jgi:PAS domain S-box-containing protein
MHEHVMVWFNNAGFMPHGHCYLWTPALLWTFVIADAVIVLSYFSIPFGLLYFVKKRQDLQFNWIFKLFSAFIFACGMTHLISIWTIWNPDYWLDAAAKAITALISLVTMALLWPLIPRALKIPSSRQLEAVVARLEDEINQRKLAEAELSRLKNLSDDRFRAVFEQVAVGVAEIESSTGRFLRINRKYCSITGYSQEEMLQQSLYSLVRPDQQTAVTGSLQALCDGRVREFSMEKWCFHRNGKHIRLNMTVSPLWEAGEAPGTSIVIAQDVTARKLAEDAAHAQLEELRRWNQSTLGREARILELKNEINALLAQAGEAPRYANASPGGGASG